MQRIGVDLEQLGKAERQRGRATWLSSHGEDDLVSIAHVVARAALFARVNPINADSAREVDAVTRAGASVLMLPMVASRHDVRRFVDIVNGRASVVVLLERREALDDLAAIVSVDGISDVHVGLNDLSLSLGLGNRWLLLADETTADIGAEVRRAGLRFGMGGIGRAFDTTLPVPSDLVYAEYARVQATSALVSRSFVSGGADIATEVARAQQRLSDWRVRPMTGLLSAHETLQHVVRHLPAW